MRRAFDYLHRGVSYDIAGAELSLPHYLKGGGEAWGPVTGQGFKCAVTNPIWYGYRYYHEARQGEEYQPKPRRPLTPSQKPPKKRRKAIRRGDDMDWQSAEGVRREMLLVPVQLHDAATLQPIEPLMTKEAFDAAQELVRKRAALHPKTTKHADPFLARRVLQCACGKRFYAEPILHGMDTIGTTAPACTTKPDGSGLRIPADSPAESGAKISTAFSSGS